MCSFSLPNEDYPANAFDVFAQPRVLQLGHRYHVEAVWQKQVFEVESEALAVEGR